MKPYLTMAFVKSEKPYEKRIALLPQDITSIKHVDQMYFEHGYGDDFGIDDDAYVQMGCHMVTKAEALSKDIICDTKIGDASYLASLEKRKTLIGWIHAGANKQLTDTLVHRYHTCYAWEDFYEDGRHLFWQNNQIAGAGGVMNAMQSTGYLPYGKKAAIIGRGDSAQGACYMLTSLGAQVQQYSRKQEALFIKELPQFDIVVMAVRWDTKRDDYLISSQSRMLMKKDAIIIDISDDIDGAIEQSISSSIKNPIYYLDNLMVYSVCNVPSIYYKTATQGVSKVMSQFVDELIEQKENDVLKNSKIIENGKILDPRINVSSVSTN